MKPLSLLARPRRGTGSTGRGPAGIAIDLGSARTRAWTRANGLLLDVPTTVGSMHPVHRGRIVDSAAAARLLADLLGPHARGRRRRTVVATVPAGCDEVHRSDILAVLEVLGAETALMIDSAKAAALGARADLTEPLLVVDIGAQLTEVALLTGGVVSHAHCTALGVSDLGVAASATHLVEAIAESTILLVGDECGSSVVDALDRGVLLAGGGALRPELTYKLSRRLGATVHPAPAPQTAAVRGAAALLQATHRHPGTT